MRVLTMVESMLRRRMALPIALLLTGILASTLTVPVDRKGDASEYILATESLYYDRDLVFSQHDLEVR